MAEDAHVGDVGTVFRVKVSTAGLPLDLSQAIAMRIIFGKPDGSSSPKNASLLTDGKDGVMYYQTVEGDLDQPGTWRIQGYAETPNGHWHSEIDKFKVKPNIED